MRDVCEHGSLRRSCPVCEADERLWEQVQVTIARISERDKARAERDLAESRLALALKALHFAETLLSEDKMKEEATCYAVYPAWLEALEAFDKEK